MRNLEAELYRLETRFRPPRPAVAAGDRSEMDSVSLTETPAELLIDRPPRPLPADCPSVVGPRTRRPASLPPGWRDAAGYRSGDEFRQRT